MKYKIIAAIVVIAAIVAAVVFTSGGRSGGVAYVGYSTSNNHWLTLRDAAAKTAKEMGIEFIDLTPVKENIVKQKTAIDNAISMKVDGLIVGPVDSRSLGDSMDKAKVAGVPVICVDTVIEHTAVSSTVATDNVQAATLAGEYIVTKLDGKTGSVLLLGGTEGSQTAVDRRDGVTRACEKAGLKVIYRPADWQAAKAGEITGAVLDAEQDVVAIFGACDPMILGAATAVERKGKRSEVLLVGFDGTSDGCKAVKSGAIDATIRQDPARMGKEGVELMARILKGDKDIPKSIAIKAVIVDKNNVNEYIK
jgi:ABC-type sugar transport system substrate-binding protein